MSTTSVNFMSGAITDPENVIPWVVVQGGAIFPNLLTDLLRVMVLKGKPVNLVSFDSSVSDGHISNSVLGSLSP